MKRKNRENMQRAIGIIEGVSFSVKSPMDDALTSAIEILDCIMEDEEDGDGKKADGDRFDL